MCSAITVSIEIFFCHLPGINSSYGEAPIFNEQSQFFNEGIAVLYRNKKAL